MSGGLWFPDMEVDKTIPPLKEFVKNISSVEPEGRLSRGNIIPKDVKKEKHVIFECLYDGDEISWKVFLYDDYDALGVILFPPDEENLTEKHYFKGRYKQNKQSISIWGIWAEDSEYKIKFPVIIKLAR